LEFLSKAAIKAVSSSFLLSLLSLLSPNGERLRPSFPERVLLSAVDLPSKDIDATFWKVLAKGGGKPAKAKDR